MLTSNNKKNKCADIEYQDDYNSLVHGITNPYYYNFGKVNKNKESKNFVKLHNKVNLEFFYKK